MEDVRVIANTIGKLGAMIVDGNTGGASRVARKLNMLSIVIKNTDMSAAMRAECMYEIGVLRSVK